MIHYQAACKVIRYLKYIFGRDFMFHRNSELQIIGHSDVDWVGRICSRKSISGYCFFLDSSLIFWHVKKQQTISGSSSKAKYMALPSGAYELLWMMYIIKDLCISCSKPYVLYCDSLSAMHIASNPIFHERKKHLNS